MVNEQVKQYGIQHFVTNTISIRNRNTGPDKVCCFLWYSSLPRLHVRSAWVTLPKSIYLLDYFLVPFILFSELALLLQCRGSKEWGWKLLLFRMAFMKKGPYEAQRRTKKKPILSNSRIKSFRGMDGWMDGCEDFSPQYFYSCGLTPQFCREVRKL